MVYGIRQSETVGLPSDKAWKKVTPHLSLVYLLSFAQFLDAYGIMIIPQTLSNIRQCWLNCYLK